MLCKPTRRARPIKNYGNNLIWIRHIRRCTCGNKYSSATVKFLCIFLKTVYSIHIIFCKRLTKLRKISDIRMPINHLNIFIRHIMTPYLPIFIRPQAIHSKRQTVLTATAYKQIPTVPP